METKYILIIFAHVFLFWTFILCFVAYFNRKTFCKRSFCQKKPYNDLHIKPTDTKKMGRGIISTRKFSKNDIIEVSPTICKKKLSDFGSALKDYVFSGQNGETCMALGYGSLFNHKDSPNATWKIEDDQLIVTATKEIKKGQEIFISYGKSYWDSRKHVTKI